MKFKRAVEMVNTYGVKMLTAPNSNLAAVAVGRKDGGPIVGAADFSVTAFVPSKLSAQELESSGIQSFDVVYKNTVGEPAPGSYDIDVVESGSKFEPLGRLVVPASQRGKYGGNPPALNAQKWFSMPRIGIGITNPVGEYPSSLSVGTLGFFMKDDDGNQYLVSNNHVIGRSNIAEIGEPVVQPGTLDLTGIELAMMPTLADLEGNLKLAEVVAVVTINFMSSDQIPVNRVDAAVARITKSGSDLSDLSRLTYGGSILGVASPYEADENGAIKGSAKVYKVGRTTGYTEGVVTYIAGTATIPYEGGAAYFADQIIVRATADNVGPYSDAGDSGSGVSNDQHELVGLLFAGSTHQTLVNPIGQVLTELINATKISTLTVITA